MAMSEITEAKPAEDQRSRWIGVYVGVLATLLAICTMGGGNATKDATRANIEAASLWAFFQAKIVRRTVATVAADDLDLQLQTNNAMSGDGRKAVEEKIKAYRAEAARLTSDKKTNTGIDELFVRANDMEKERDVALRKDPYFDVAQALLQIAIVLASVALITGTNVLLHFSYALGAVGMLLMLNGFALFMKLPFLG